MRKFLVLMLSFVMVFAMTTSCFAVYMNIDSAETEIVLEDDFELVIPYKTYDEFVAELTFEEIDSIPEGSEHYTSIREFYDKIYGSVSITRSGQQVAEVSLGDLNATFYATISNNMFISLDHISSDISPAVIGAEWTQENYTHKFTDRNHVVSGNIYGRVIGNILTPVGFIKVSTNSYRVPYEISTNSFN